MTLDVVCLCADWCGSSARARGSNARPLSLSSRRLPARSNRRSDSSRSSSFTAELVADCDSAISALAAVVVPLRATATKICSCRSVRRRVFMADLFAKRSDGYILAIQPV